MEWTFTNNMDYVFDLCKKAGRVISSCKNAPQLDGAERYIDNLERYFTHFKKTKKQQEFANKQIKAFREILRLKTKMARADFN